MTDQYMAQMQLFAFDWAPVDWARCDGQLLQINQFQALYSLLGTMYGGNGTTTFALPDTRGRVLMHDDASIGYFVGQRVGVEHVTLSVSELPAHRHNVHVRTVEGADNSPLNAFLANSEEINAYASPTASLGSLNNATLSSTGENQPHDNMQPTIVMNWTIALVGLYPSRN